MAVIFLNSWRGFQGDYYAKSRPEKRGQVSVGTMRIYTWVGPPFGMSESVGLLFRTESISTDDDRFSEIRESKTIKACSRRF